MGINIEPGVYIDTDNTIVKVTENKAKTGVYALVWTSIGGKRLTLSSEKVNAEWRYAKGLIYNLKPEYRMTLDEAHSFTLIFGVCARCSRKLKAAESVEKGVGPVCAKTFAPSRKAVAA